MAVARKNSRRNALQTALGLLARREHSRDELGRKLDSRGFEPDEAEAALDKLASAGWQDDVRFAESLVRTRANAGYGPLRIRAELGTHGLEREAIAAALRAFDAEWVGKARELFFKRVGNGRGAAADLARRRKAADFLYRRGFTAGHVNAALMSVIADQPY